jgi:epoxyqueuosine reductase QueG
MKKIVLFLLLVAGSAFAFEINKAQIDLFKKESAALRQAIDDMMSVTLGRGMTEFTKAAYLEGYGAVFTLEVSLEPTRSPFSSPKTPAEVRAVVAERRKAIENKLESLLKQRAESFQSLGPADALSVVVHVFNSNPVDVPDLPSEIVFTVKKQDPTQVLIRAY